MVAAVRGRRPPRGRAVVPARAALLRSLACQGRPLPARAQFCDLAMQLLPALTSSPKVVAKEAPAGRHLPYRSEEHTSELQSLMRISYAVFCLKKKIKVYNPIRKDLHNTYKVYQRYIKNYTL